MHKHGRTPSPLPGATALLGLLLLIGPLAAPLAAHGGNHNPPQSQPRPMPGWTAPAAPASATGGGGIPAAAPPAAGPSSSASGGFVRGRGSRAGSTGTGAGNFGASEDIWEFWWAHNGDRFLDLKSRLVATPATSGLGVLTGRGRSEGPESTRPTRARLEADVVPVLTVLLRDATDRDILDSSVLALARISHADNAGAVVSSLRPLLAYDQLTVQTSTALSLGVLGAELSRAMLVELAGDSRAGRMLVGGGDVPKHVRAFAILGLGLVGRDEDVEVLMSLAGTLPDSERDMKASAIVALGLGDTERSDEIVRFLTGLLEDRRLDPTIQSFVPTAMGKLGNPMALRSLVDALRDRDTNSMVRQSAAIGLGRLGSAGQDEVLDALVDAVVSSRDMATRHFALMGLARIGARARGRRHADAHDRIVDLLLDEIQKPRRADHRPWAALAAAVYAREHAPRRATLTEALRVTYGKERNPSHKAALALALGLVGDTSAAPDIAEDFVETSDADFRGYAALALGFLAHEEALPAMRAACLDPGSDATFRMQAATGLALMQDRAGVELLTDMLASEPNMAVREAATRALGLVGDRETLPPLLDIVGDDGQADLARAFACVALGMVGEKTALRWNVLISEDNNYLTHVEVIDAVLRIL